MASYTPPPPRQGLKDAIKSICSSLKPAVSWAVKKPGNALRIGFQAVNYLIVVLVCMAILNLSKSGFLADFRLFSKAEDGKIVVGEVIAKKKEVPVDENKNLLFYERGLNHDSIGYGRKVISVFGFDVYGTVRWQDHKSQGNTVGIGISISF